MNDDVLRSLGLEELDRIDSCGGYESSPLRRIMDRHTLRYVRLEHRITGRLAMEALFELYLYACQATDRDAVGGLLPEHYCCCYGGVRSFALNYGETYDAKGPTEDPHAFRSAAPRSDFARNFELFCAREPSPKAHGVLLAVGSSLSRHLEEWLWSRLPPIQLSEEASEVRRVGHGLTLSMEEYTSMLQRPDTVAEKLSMLEGATQEEVALLAKLYIIAAETCVQESSSYEPSLMRDILSEFCEQSLSLVRQMIYIVYDEDEQPEPTSQCRRFLRQLLLTAKDPNPQECSQHEYLNLFPDAARTALRCYCSLVMDKQCPILWPAIVWALRIARLQLEWKAAELAVGRDSK